MEKQAGMLESEHKQKQQQPPLLANGTSLPVYVLVSELVVLRFSCELDRNVRDACPPFVTKKRFANLELG